MSWMTSYERYVLLLTATATEVPFFNNNCYSFPFLVNEAKPTFSPQLISMQKSLYKLDNLSSSFFTTSLIYYFVKSSSNFFTNNNPSKVLTIDKTMWIRVLTLKFHEVTIKCGFVWPCKFYPVVVIFEWTGIWVMFNAFRRIDPLSTIQLILILNFSWYSLNPFGEILL